MNIQHNPIFDTQKVVKLYSEKDGVPVKYVCTSSLNKGGTYAADIFYRETPHPEFGNRYFGLYYNMYDTRVTQKPEIMIANADNIEDLAFDMIEVDGQFHYSQHRHDFRSIGNRISIDGGREYFRALFDDRDYYMSCAHKVLKVKDGEFVDAD